MVTSIEPIPGLVVQRTVPFDVITGLGKQYKMYGGVVRWAPGTKYAGQIVRHLIPVGDRSNETSIFDRSLGRLVVANAYQLRELSGTVNALSAVTQQVLQVATTTMMLSGLNLAVSMVGFAVLNQKLKRLEGRLSEIQKEVQAIHALLELEERAKLGAALRDLLNIDQITNLDHRHTLLFNAKNVLAPISLKYRELLTGADTLETAMAYEEYFCLTTLAHVRCTAELGILNMARCELEEMFVFWQEQARHIANDYLLGDNPERFLFSDFAQHAPVSMLVEWLDFAYAEERGYLWIDELRSKTSPWYAEVGAAEIGKGTGRFVSSFGKRLAERTRRANIVDEMDIERERVIPSFHKLVARDNVLAGYVSQYELLEAHNITPSELNSRIAALPPEAAVDGYIILQPAAELPAEQQS